MGDEMSSDSSFPPPRLVVRLVPWATGAYWLVLFGATHVPAYALPKVPVSDKIEHLVCYGLLATLLMLTFHVRGKFHAGTGITVLALLLAYGAIDEWTQIPVGRSCELADWYADAAGSGVAVVLMTFVLRRLYDHSRHD